MKSTLVNNNDTNEGEEIKDSLNESAKEKRSKSKFAAKIKCRQRQFLVAFSLVWSAISTILLSISVLTDNWISTTNIITNVSGTFIHKTKAGLWRSCGNVEITLTQKGLSFQVISIGNCMPSS